MVADALKGNVDRLIAVTADTDLGPAIRMIATSTPQCEVFVAAPPRRFGKCRSLKPRLELTPGRIGKCLLPAEVRLPDGKIVKRPPSYTPPT
jgi:hypothetical protein